jgi:hypothetical protein
MPDNIATHVATVNLAEHAEKIRTLGKRVREDVIEIGRLLVEVREGVDHGVWLSWLETEFQWADQTAYRFIHLYEKQQDPGFHKLWNSDLPLSALGQLAAPKVPPEARDEVANRLEAGETLGVAEVTKVIKGAKRKKAAKVPSAPDIPAAPSASATETPSADESAEKRKALYAADVPATDAKPDLSIPDFLKRPLASAATTEESETLAAHWHRASPAERKAFLDAIGVGAMLKSMSPEFERALRDAVPAKHRAPPGRPFNKTITLSANPPASAGGASRS